jgi:thioesterase domain-containing protein
MKTRSNISSTIISMSKCSSGGSLVFFPDFGGNVLYAKPIVQKLAKDLSCYGIRFESDLVENFDNLSLIDIAAHFARDIAKANLPKPINVCGFSFAGYFAFETAHWLSETHALASRLIILDTSIRSNSLYGRLAQSPLREILYAIRYLSNNWTNLVMGKTDPLMLRKYGQIRFDLSQHPESYRYVIRQLFKMMSAYNPRKWEVGEAIILKARQNNGLWNYGTGDLGWHKFISGPITTLDVPGDHLSMLRDPENADILAEMLRKHIGLKLKGTENAQPS